MSGNQFTIYSGWGPRDETPTSLGERMLRSLDALSKLNPLFENWWLLNQSLSLEDLEDLEPGAGGFPLQEVRGRMAEIVKLGVDEADDGDPTPMTGYSISALNSPLSSPKSVGLRVHGGDSVNLKGWRDAVFETEYGEFPDPSIVSYQVFKAALLTIVSNWNVDYAQAHSQDLMLKWRQIPWRRRFDLSWMTYLSASLAKQITPPSDVLIECTPDGGLLMIAVEQTFEVTNPGHMAAAASIVDAVAPFNIAADDADREKISRYMRSHKN